MAELTVEPTPIPGMVVVRLPLHGDSRGWFKENWQREKMIALGLPDFTPVQNNISYNEAKGVTRGFHAEPWDKYVSVGFGRVFCAWVDLRPGSFGKTFSIEVDPGTAVFVPRGVANGFQTLEDNSVYTYLVTQHWSADLRYVSVKLDDPTVAMEWPIPLSEATISDKDRGNPALADVAVFPAKPTAVFGANGQLGRQLVADFDDVAAFTRDSGDVTDATSLARLPWGEFGAVVNAAAYTAVDVAESSDGRIAAWNANVSAVGNLVRHCNEQNIPLVHVSSDYVFDGSKAGAYDEADELCPLGVYGQTKAAGDAVASTARQHYIVRSSWVIGDGNNFVKTMYSLARKGVSPSVVGDQLGRLTFTQDMVAAISHLLDSRAPFGTYNLSNSGDVVSWADVAREVYRLAGADSAMVTSVTTEQYFADKPEAAPRPLNSALDLTKIEATGFTPMDWRQRLAEYVGRLDSL